MYIASLRNNIKCPDGTWRFSDIMNKGVATNFFVGGGPRPWSTLRWVEVPKPQFSAHQWENQCWFPLQLKWELTQRTFDSCRRHFLVLIWVGCLVCVNVVWGLGLCCVGREWDSSIRGLKNQLQTFFSKYIASLRNNIKMSGRKVIWWTRA